MTRAAAAAPLALLVALLALHAPACARPEAPTRIRAPSAPGLPSEWPTFQRDNARTGAQPDAPMLQRKPRVAWSARVGAQAASHGPLLVGDMVIVASHGAVRGAADAEDGVVALRRDTGARAWAWASKQDVHAIAYASGAIIATGESATWAIDAQTGALLWRAKHARGHGAAHAVLISGAHVIIAHTGGHLVARALGSGAQLWHVRLSGPVARGLASASGVVLVGTQTGALTAHDLQSGRTLWTATIPAALQGAILAPPTLHNRQVVLSTVREGTTARASVFALRLEDGALLWSARLDPKTQALPGASASATIAHARYHLPLDGSGYLVGVAHARTDQLDYIATTGPCLPTSPASPVAATSIVYLPRDDGALYALRMDHPAAPALGAWRLYLGEHAKTDRLFPAALKALPRDRCPTPLPTTPPLPPRHPLPSTPAVSTTGDLYITSAEGFLYRLIP